MLEIDVKKLAEKCDVERKNAGKGRIKYSLGVKQQVIELIAQGMQAKKLSEQLKIHIVTFNKWHRILRAVKKPRGKKEEKEEEEVFTLVESTPPASEVFYLETPSGLKIKTTSMATMVSLIKDLALK